MIPFDQKTCREEFTMNEFTKVHTVNNILEARDTIAQLERDGYLKENIFVLTHDKARTDHITEYTDGNKIGVAEEGVITAVANLFRSTGDKLRAKMKSMGVSDEHAHQLEREMDNGKIVILAWGGTVYEQGEYDQNVSYFPPYDNMPLL
jgi:hypothetical protein